MEKKKIKNYWDIDQQQYCITIATSDDNNEINKAFQTLEPSIQKMYITILRRYFSNTIESKNETATGDLYSHLREKIYMGLKKNYDATSSSYSYVQAIIKFGIIDSIRSKKDKMHKASINITDVPLSTEDTYDFGDNLFQPIIDEVYNEIAMCKKENKYEKYIIYLNLIKDVLTTPLNGELNKNLISLYISSITNEKVVTINQYLYTKKRDGVYLHKVMRKNLKNITIPPYDDINDLNNKLNDRDARTKELKNR